MAAEDYQNAREYKLNEKFLRKSAKLNLEQARLHERRAKKLEKQKVFEEAERERICASRNRGLAAVCFNSLGEFEKAGAQNSLAGKQLARIADFHAMNGKKLRAAGFYDAAGTMFKKAEDCFIKIKKWEKASEQNELAEKQEERIAALVEDPNSNQGGGQETLEN